MNCKVYNVGLCISRRYFKYELLAKGAISKEDLPVFLSAWLDRSNSTCMFSANQQRTWSTSHLTGGGWYLDCAPSFTPSFESELRKSREAVGESGVEMVDLQGIEDEHERAKALARRIEEDRKKSLKVKEAEEKAVQKEMEKLQKSLEKTNVRGKKKMHSHSEPEGKSLVSPTPTNDSGSQAPTLSRGTKRDSSYDLLSPVFNLGEETESPIDELILNASMKEVLGGSSDDYTSYYKDLKSFMMKVLFLLPFMPTLTTLFLNFTSCQQFHIFKVVCMSLLCFIYVKCSNHTLISRSPHNQIHVPDIISVEDHIQFIFRRYTCI